MSSTKGSIYEILKKPRITEKSAMLSSQGNTIVFDVHVEANKKEIQAAVEKIFEVKVLGVRTSNCFGKGKKPNLRGGNRGDWKKAYVTLEKGKAIDIIEGL